MKRFALASGLAYIAVVSMMGRHLLSAPGAAIASDAGDPVLNAAILAWNATHLPGTGAWFQFPIFHPTRDALTLSEHLLGVSVVATPIYWLTGNAAIAYNLTLLASYPLCGLAMFALVWRVTRSAPAAFLSGLAFAFAPYRASHLPHVQVLTVFWAPLALLGLHAFTETRKRRWLGLFGLAWLLQGAANGYFLVYFSVLVGLWVLWFVLAKGRWRDAGWIAAAAGVAALPLIPVLYRYLVAQRELGLSRNLGEIASFSADIAAPLCAPGALTFWAWLRVACGQEGELFVGATLVVLCVAGMFYRRVRDPLSGGHAEEQSGALRAAAAIRRLAAGIAVVYIGIAIGVLVAGPLRIDLGWMRASASTPDKPLSTALALLLVALLASRWFRMLLRRGSMATFYLGAALICWVLTWGPFPRLLGVDVLYQAPYAWLLQVPGVAALRAPSRFSMMMVLCLAVLAGLGVAELLRGRSRRVSAAVVVAGACGLLIDGWATIPAAAIPPPPIANAESLRGAPVLVLPAGERERDVATVYHAVAGGWRTINGYSGYEPAYYDALRTLSQARDPVMLEPFLRRGDIHVVDSGAVRRVPARPGVRAPIPLGARLAARVHDASCSREAVAYAVDGDIETQWVCGVQNADHEITIDLGHVAQAGAVVHALGSSGSSFPRHLVIETSPDLVRWESAWEGSPAAAVLEEALEAPRRTGVVIPFPPRAARFVRLRQTGRHEAYWSIAELEVWSGQPRG